MPDDLTMEEFADALMQIHPLKWLNKTCVVSRNESMCLEMAARRANFFSTSANL